MHKLIIPQYEDTKDSLNWAEVSLVQHLESSATLSYLSFQNSLCVSMVHSTDTACECKLETNLHSAPWLFNKAKITMKVHCSEGQHSFLPRSAHSSHSYAMLQALLTSTHSHGLPPQWKLPVRPGSFLRKTTHIFHPCSYLAAV